MEEVNSRKRSRVGSDPVESEFQLDSTKAKKFKDDLLSILDDPEPVPESDPDLDSVIRSFEEEITRSSGSQASVIDLTSDSGENLPEPELGQLFSDESEIGVVEGGEFSEIGDLWNFQDELAPSYDDSFGLGISYDFEEIIGSNNNNDSNKNNKNSEYVALDGIFDYGSDVNFGSDFLWRQDSLPAI